MIRGFSAHLNTLYGEPDPAERCVHAAADGFRCVEMWAPPSREQAPSLLRALGRHDLELAAVNTNAGPNEEDFGRLGDPDAATWWRRDFLATLDFARQAGAASINVLAGGRCRNVSRADQLHCVAQNLEWALATRTADDPLLLLEPLNAAERRSPLLQRTADAVAVIRQLGCPPGLMLLFDLYHVVQEDEGFTDPLSLATGLIGHVQIADFPGRGRPGTGDAPVASFLAALAETEYTGWVGLEYFRGSPAEPALSWLEAPSPAAASVAVP
jgi:hydroxypyruvate isomerase